MRGVIRVAYSFTFFNLGLAIYVGLGNVRRRQGVGTAILTRVENRSVVPY